MATLELYQYFSVTGADGQTIEFGSRANPREVTVDGYKSDETKSLTTGATWDVWDSTSEEGLTNFDIAGFLSTQAVFLELTVDRGAEVGTEDIAIELQANREFILSGGDDAMGAHTQDFAGTETEDVIDRIRIRNVSGSTAIVRALFIT